MNKSNCSEEQHAFTRKQAALGVPILEMRRKLAPTELVFFRWKSEYGEITLSVSIFLFEIRNLLTLHAACTHPPLGHARKYRERLKTLGPII